MFVSASAFHTQIADPIIGGTYLTLLNTVSNLGGTWPRYFILEGVDLFTKATCILPKPTAEGRPVPSRLIDVVHSCATEPERQQCIAEGGNCHKYVDGYYVVNTLCVSIGFILFFGYIRPRVTKLQAIATQAWKIPGR
jgi:MFS transporter, PAT family, solute carrier family 33 (acetyl-CoA transportor), member 1